MVEAFVSESGRASIRWVARDLKPPVLYRAAELFREGHTVRQVADLLGVSRSEAGRLRLKAAADGAIDAVGQDESEDLEAAVEGRFRLN
jgi:DNA-binding transcriptional regulator LsrR (DeoR family)